MADDQQRLTDEELVAEARQWESGEKTMKGWFRGDLMVLAAYQSRRTKVDDNSMKERALFFLDRIIKGLETEVIDQQKMAEMCMSYTDRIAAKEATDQKETENQLELGALRWARSKLEKLK